MSSLLNQPLAQLSLSRVRPIPLRDLPLFTILEILKILDSFFECKEIGANFILSRRGFHRLSTVRRRKRPRAGELQGVEDMFDTASSRVTYLGA